MRVKINRARSNQNQDGAEDHRAFHEVGFRPSFNQAPLHQDLSASPFLIANMGSIPDKCAARL